MEKQYQAYAHKIIALQNADLALRDKLLQQGLLNEGYNPEMRQMHNDNAAALEKIIDTIGYPTIDKVGKEASEAAWLVIQHAIDRPPFMKKCLHLLQEAVIENKVDPIGMAYLQDRICVYEGKPQLYGTQFDWDAQGMMSPNPYDDLHLVNQRRASLGLNSLEEQTLIMRRRPENQTPPKDLAKRNVAYEAWCRAVGWV